MNDDGASLPLEMTARLVAMALHFALTGRVPAASDEGGLRQKDEQADQIEIENLFWD